MRSPLRVFSGRTAATMPGDDDVLAAFGRARPCAGRRRRAGPGRGVAGDSRSAIVRAPYSLQIRGVAVDRVAAPEQAERFLLEGELLDLGPRRRVAAAAATAAPGSARSSAAAEQVGLPLVAVALRLGCRARRRRRARPSAARAAAAWAAARPAPSGGASESSAPALTRLSSTRLLTSRRSTPSHSSCSDRKRPVRARCSRIDEDRVLADVLHRGEAEAHALRRHREPQLALVDVGRQHRDAAVAALAEVQRQLVGVLRLDGQQRRGEVPRVVRLQVRRLVGQVRVRRSSATC